MSVNESIRVLTAEITKHLEVLDELEAELNDAIAKDLALLGKTKRSAAMIASIIESYYTCAETFFLRVSQYFENNLSDNRWHKDLLDKMALEIKDIRPKLLSDEVYKDMEELLRFRHFKRYYFNLAYDWERLEEVIKRARRVHPALKADVVEFLNFLKSLSEV